MLRCSLSYAKIMQIECRTTSLLDCYAEMQLILCKDNARREQNEINKFISYAEPKLILSKDNPITFKHKIKGSETYLFSLNPTKILYARTTTESLQVQTTDLGLNHIHEIFPTAWGRKPHIRGFYSPRRGGNSDLCDSLWRFDYILSEYHITTREFSRR